MGDAHPPDTVAGRFVAGNEFSTLGVPMALGRPIQPSDDTEGAPPVAVISYRMWQRRLALDPHIIGMNLTMNGVVVTVVGVTAPEYQGEIVQSDPPELWLALNQEAKFTGAAAAHTHHPDTHWLDVVGRIAPDATTGSDYCAAERGIAAVAAWPRHADRPRARTDRPPEDASFLPQRPV